jgi:hypothetical protein
MPTAYMSTAVALTVEAREPEATLLSPTVAATNEENEQSATQKVEEVATAPPTPELPSATPIEESEEIPAAAPTPEPQLPPVQLPAGTIQILSPGPGSKVVSPFLLRAALIPGPNGVVRIELLGEDGRLLMREVKVYNLSPGARISLGSEVKFEISAVAEAARAQILVEDNHGRTMALASVDLILLSIGDADINPVVDTLENIIIEEPNPNALIQGGQVLVSGLARLRGDQPLLIEIQTDDGRVVGTRQVSVVSPQGGGHGTFAIDVPYTLSATTRARLFIWERGARIPGIAHLSSLEVVLSP